MGPTACGKSALALEIAARRPAVIINMDAMQMVAALRVITARPTEDEEKQAAHALYGVLKAEEPTSVAVWLKLVAPVIRAAWAQAKLPVLVGGTGMYLKALMEGLAEVPPVPDEVRAKVRSWNSEGEAGAGGKPSPLAGEGLDEGAWGEGSGLFIAPSPNPLPQGERASPAAPTETYSRGLYVLLQQKDPVMAARLKPGDTQRILRALEVMEATGVSLAEWQGREVAPMFPEARYAIFAVSHAREEIYARIDRRFKAMMEQGALDEVRALMGLGLSVELPIMRAHGVPELMAYLRGEMTLEAAVAKGQQNTRNYAKRQMTWLRNQLPDAVEVAGAAAVLEALG